MAEGGTQCRRGDCCLLQLSSDVPPVPAGVGALRPGRPIGTVLTEPTPTHRALNFGSKIDPHFASF